MAMSLMRTIALGQDALFGIGKSKPFTSRHRRNGARGRPKSGDGYHA